MRLVNPMPTLSMERSFKLRVLRDAILEYSDRIELATSMMAVIQDILIRLQGATDLSGLEFDDQRKALNTMWNAIPHHSTLDGLQQYSHQAIEQILIIEQGLVDALCRKIGAEFNAA